MDVIDVTSDRPSYDTRWRATDSNGHEHRYDHGFPTLSYVVDERHWCDGTEGFMLHEPHWAVDADHYECELCGAVVEPGLLPAGYPQYIDGMKNVSLKGRRSDGIEVDVALYEAEFDTLASAAASDDETAMDRAVLAMLDEMPSERWASVTFASR
jgi:hypothetical protein